MATAKVSERAKGGALSFSVRGRQIGDLLSCRWKIQVF